MAEELKTAKRAFHEDIFADDADKWSWPGGGQNSSKPSGSGAMYDTHTSEVKSESSSSANSGEGFVFRGDSNSLKRSFRKRGSSFSSEGNQEDASLSPQPSVGLTHERLIPSMYDDDARSGSPSSVFEKKDLAFRSSFNKSIDSSPLRSQDSSPLPAAGSKRLPSDRESKSQSDSSLRRRDSKDSRSRQSPSDGKARSSRSHSRSRDKKYRRRSKTRSLSRDRRGKSPLGRRRSRSRDRRPDRRRRHSRSRRSPSRDRRSRSRSYDKHRRRSHYRSSSRERRRRRRYSRSRSHSRDRSRGGTMTPQMALQQTMAAMNAKAQALTGVPLPKYYNPAAVNPLKYAEQVQKRKLLWQSKEKVEEAAPKSSVWEKMTFAQDQDGKMTAKFRKLMGMKVPETTSPVEGEDKEEALKKQEKLFSDLDQQYEMARLTTHTQRGVGLGYSSQALFPVQK